MVKCRPFTILTCRAKLCRVVTKKLVDVPTGISIFQYLGMNILRIFHKGGRRINILVRISIVIADCSANMPVFVMAQLGQLKMK